MRPEVISTEQGKKNTLNNWAKKLKDPRGELTDLKAKLKSGKSELEDIEEMVPRERIEIREKINALEEFLGMDKTVYPKEKQMSLEELSGVLGSASGPKKGGIIDTHFNQGGLLGTPAMGNYKRKKKAKYGGLLG